MFPYEGASLVDVRMPQRKMMPRKYFCNQLQFTKLQNGIEKQNYFKGLKELHSHVITNCWQIKKHIYERKCKDKWLKTRLIPSPIS